MNFLEKIEKRIDEAVRKLSGRAGAAREPLEIMQNVLREIEDKVTSLGGGRRIFPFDRVVVYLYAEDDERRTLYETVFVREQPLAGAVRELLRPPGCEIPNGLSVEARVVEPPPPDEATEGFHIVYGHSKSGPAAQTGERVKGQLVVVRGEAAVARYKITKKRTNLGRQSEVIDKDGMPLRKNDLAFLENGSEINQTVSRVHAHIKLDPDTDTLRLYDDNSAYGTTIIRASGRRVKVSGRVGTALQSGDEIYLGKASLRFRLD